MAKKKSTKKTSKEKPKKVVISPKSTHTGNFQTVLLGLSSYIKQSGSQTAHRGSYAKKAAEIYNAIKDKPEWEENLDVIIPQFIGAADKSVKLVTEEKSDAKEFEDYIRDNAFTRFDWWLSDSDFQQLMLSERWTPDTLLVISDSIGNTKFYKEHINYRESLYQALKYDYRDDKFTEPYPVFEFYRVYTKEGHTYVEYSLKYWDLVGFDETMRDVVKLDSERDKRTEEREKEKKKTKTEKKEDFDRELEIEKIKYESGRIQKAYEYDRSVLSEEFKQGLWTKEEYKAEQLELKKTYNLI